MSFETLSAVSEDLLEAGGGRSARLTAAAAWSSMVLGGSELGAGVHWDRFATAASPSLPRRMFRVG